MGPLLTDSILVSFSQMIKQTEQPLACLKCLVDVKQLMCSCSFCSQTFFEISKSIRTDSCFWTFSNPLSQIPVKSQTWLAVLLRWCLSGSLSGVSPPYLLPLSPGVTSYSVTPWGAEAQGGFVTRQCLAPKVGKRQMSRVGRDHTLFALCLPGCLT